MGRDITRIQAQKHQTVTEEQHKRAPEADVGFFSNRSQQKAIQAQGAPLVVASNRARTRAILGIGALPDDARSPVIQRRFGFELEVNVALEALEGGQYHDPKATHGVHLAKGNGFKIHVDHQKQQSLVGFGVVDAAMYNNNAPIPIVEIVTDPLDEFAPNALNNLNQLITSVETFRNELENNLGKREPLSSFTGISAYKAKKPLGNVLVGGQKKGAQNLSTYPHATYGIKLSKVNSAFDQHAQKISGARGGGEPLSENLHSAHLSAGAVEDMIFNTYKDKKSGALFWKDLNTHDIHDRSDLDKITGLVTMLVNYVLSYDKDAGELSKNRIGALYYKTKLSEVPALLSDKQRKFLSGHARELTAILVDAAQQARGNPLQGEAYWRGWIRDVLQGDKDKFLEGTINPYSDPLGPEPIGAGHQREDAVVLENRHVTEMFRQVGRRIPANEWGDMMRGVFALIQQINA